uniref:Uncharacterized protein n=1 Tax=Rhizophora mucronata TaxID=61149 RepID=A0A2P2QDH6_RHIMU
MDFQLLLSLVLTVTKYQKYDQGIIHWKQQFY